MGFFDSFQDLLRGQQEPSPADDEKLGKQAFKTATRDGVDMALAWLSSQARDRPLAYVHLAIRLHERQEDVAASQALQAALGIDPACAPALLLLAEIASEAGRGDEAIALYRRALAVAPGDPIASFNLAEALVESGRPAEALEALPPPATILDEELQFLAARALHHSGRSQEALPIVHAHRARHEEYIRMARSHQGGLPPATNYNEVMALHMAIVTATEESPLSAGDRSVAQGAELQSPEAEREAAEAALDDGDDLRGLCLLGSAALREGDLALARRCFREARALDEDHDTAADGLAAIEALENVGDTHAAAALPEPLASPHLEAVVPALACLTEEELRVVVASVRPLQSVLPTLASAGATVRILPLGVSPDDVVVGDEQECGMDLPLAVARSVAACPVTSLPDVASAQGWAFAHVLAHLAVHHLPAERTARLSKLRERAATAGYIWSPAETADDGEFLAAAVVDYLRNEHGVPLACERDDEGIVDAVREFVADLA